MRLPNGTGSVYKDKSRPLRKPYKAIVTLGWKMKDGKALPIRKCLGYFKTKQEGLAALLDFQNNGLPKEITFGDVMGKWFEENEWSYSTTKGYRSQSRKLSALMSRPIKALKVADLENVLDAETPANRAVLRIILHGSYDWAMRHEYIDKDYSKLIRSYGPANSKEKIPFSDEEIETLWKDGSDIANSVLVAIYSGWRWNELMSFAIDGDNMIGGSKTKAGKNRIVPIHPRIKPIIDKMFVTPSYGKFNYQFRKLMDKYSMVHSIHETRHTTATRLFGQDEHLVKLILGHAEKDLTKRVYTHNTIEQLRQVIETML